MVFIVVQAPNQLTRVFRTTRDPITIGRSPDAELTLPNISVSRLHARLSGHDIENLEPGNPIFCNGAPIMRGPLAHGDELRIGKYRLIFYRSEELDVMTSLQLEELPPHTSVLAAESSAATHAIPASVHEKLARQEQLRDQAALVDADGRRWPLGEGATIGPGADIPATAALARSALATVQWQGTAHVIRRAGWLGRVTVNGAAVREHTLRPGDQLQVGRATFTYAP